MVTKLPKFVHTSIVLSVISLIFIYTLTPIFARSLDEINRYLSSKQGELNEVNKELDAAKKEYEKYKSVEQGASGEVEKIRAEIEAIEAKLKYNQLQLEQLAQQKEIKTLEIEENEKRQDLQVDVSYKSWKTGDYLGNFFGGNNVVRSTIYNEALTTKSHGGILGIATELEGITSEYEGFLTDSQDLQEEMNDLADKKAEAEAKLAVIQVDVAAAGKDLSQVRSTASALQSQINQLTKEQQEIQKQEADLIKNSGGGGGGGNSGGTNGGTIELNSGEYYFNGSGRDLYQGHGVGMSQFGALGAALAGWDYKKIVQFYFPGTQVGKLSNLPGSINVDGVGQVATESYVAGAGEVPDYACEDLGVAFNPNNVWACWPREAIKAQAVVFRTYGARRAGFVYRDTRGQVYKGGDKKKWAADATKGETANYNGGLADTYYSADNNQGYGNANNDTVWSNYAGDGTNIPYLRSVNDNSFAFKTQWTNWKWRSNSYTNTELDGMLKWVSTNGAVSSGARSYMAIVKNDIGTLQSISFERDPSQRVKKVVLKGNKGTRKIAGWFYKSLWNIWVGTAKPSGQTDYIYSLTYFLKQG